VWHPDPVFRRNAEQAALEDDFPVADLVDAGRQFEQIVVAGGGQVAHGDVPQPERPAALFLGQRRQARGPQQFEASQFEKGQVPAVMDHAHLVGLVVADAKLDGMFDGHEGA